MHKLESSFLEGCQYDHEKELLTVYFQNSKEFEYAGVPKSVYEGFIEAKSAGNYYSTYIKTNYPMPE